MGTVTERRLAAVLLADVAGFSGLMEKDEAGTFQAVRALREQIATPLITEHGGRVVKTTGDGFLAEFSSATAALRCAIEIQRRNQARESARPEGKRLHLRIGINVGDIINDGDDIAGDGVNVAARLESLAPRDGICISAAVREHVREDLGVSYEPMGEQQVKNISRPIQAFCVDPTGKATFGGGSSATGALRAASRKRRATWTAAVALSAIAAIAIGFFLPHGAKPPGPATGAALAPYSPEDRRMTFAVLPMAVPDGDADAANFADKAMDALIASPPQWQIVRVVSRESVEQAVQQHSAARDLAHALGVRFLLRGKVTRQGKGFSLTVTLVDAERDSVLKTLTKDFPSGSVPHPDHSLVGSLMGAVHASAIESEAETAKLKPPAERDARDLYFLAIDSVRQATPEAYAKTLELLGKAIALAPDSWEIQLAMATLHICDICGWTLEEMASRHKAGMEELEQFLVRHPEQRVAQLFKAASYQQAGRYDDALVILNRLVEKSPQYTPYHGLRAYVLVKLARGSEALRDVSIVLAESSEGDALALAASANYLAGKYTEAAEKARSARPNLPREGIGNPYIDPMHLVQAAAEARLGKRKEAEAALADFRALVPGMNSLADIRKWMNPRSPLAAHEPLYEGLALLGVPK